MTDSRFDELIAEAEHQPFSGWDFSYLAGRRHDGPISWDYADLLRPKLDAVTAVLDMGTGGGELLARLVPLPARSVATEGYAPNVEVARARLAPLGVEVVRYGAARDNAYMSPGEGLGTLPFPDESFPLVIDRHESYYAADVFRILTPGGRFVTQQVGGEYMDGLNQALGAPPGYSHKWNLEFAVRQLEEAGFTIDEQREEFPEIVFTDIGAVAYYLKAVPWQIEGFTIQGYRDRLATLHRRIERDGELRVRGHYFYIEAVNSRS